MGTNDEFYADAAQQRLNELNAERMRAQHDLAISLSQGDREAAGREIQDIADIDAKQANLLALAQREADRNQPPPARRHDAWTTKRSDEMDYEDAYHMINQTSENAKLGGGISREEYINNIRRLQQEKAKGYHQR